MTTGSWKIMLVGTVITGLFATVSAAAAGQDSAPTPAATETTAKPKTAAAPAVSIEDAYRREYALLTEQKRELSGRLAATKADMQREQGKLEGEIAGFESRLMADRSAAENAADELNRVSETSLAAAERADLVDATVQQATVTLESLGYTAASPALPEDATPAERLQPLFDAALAKLTELSSMQTSEGTFYLADGSETRGTVIRYGNVAAFGVSKDAAGSLVPAGGGRFRLWPDTQGDTAQRLTKGQTPEQLGIFLFDSTDTAIEDPTASSVAAEVRKGGIIGYVIVGLGLVALVLVALRSMFLYRAQSAIGQVHAAAEPHVRAGRIDDAIAAAKQHKGSAARVVTAALRNLDVDREHLEDIITESILHESSRLSRFGTMITVVAAVAPLLGLLGTVTGMIQTFDIITEFGTSDPKLLSGGIATALVTTELGLIVAIPALLLGSLLNGWADRLRDDMEKAALAIVNLVQDVRSPRLAAKSSPEPAPPFPSLAQPA